MARIILQSYADRNLKRFRPTGMTRQLDLRGRRQGHSPMRPRTSWSMVRNFRDHKHRYVSEDLLRPCSKLSRSRQVQVTQVFLTLLQRLLPTLNHTFRAWL
jgi:hypothetical protein